MKNTMIQLSDAWTAPRNHVCCLALGEPLPTHAGQLRGKLGGKTPFFHEPNLSTIAVP